MLLEMFFIKIYFKKKINNRVLMKHEAIENDLYFCRAELRALCCGLA